MANAYKFRPQYTQNEIGPDGGTGESSSTTVAPAVAEIGPEQSENDLTISLDN